MWFERGLGPAGMVIPATVSRTGYSEIAAILWVAHLLSAAAGVVAGRIVGCERRCGVWEGAQEEECSFARCTLRGPGTALGDLAWPDHGQFIVRQRNRRPVNGVQAINNLQPIDEHTEKHLLVIFPLMPCLPNFQGRVAAASPAKSRVSMHVIAVTLINLIRSRYGFQDLIHSFHAIAKELQFVCNYSVLHTDAHGLSIV